MKEYKLRAIHTSCGSQVAWIHNPNVLRIKASNFERMDGTYPKPNERINEICPGCGERIDKLDII